MTTTTDTRYPARRNPDAIDAPVFSIWAWASIAAALALFFPKIQGIRGEGHSAWGLLYFYIPTDIEGLILIPIIVAATLALFRLLGGWALRNSKHNNRPARVGLITSVCAIVAIIAFWISAPIVLGTLAIMLGLAGRQQAPTQQHGNAANAAIALGATATIAGAALWSLIV